MLTEIDRLNLPHARQPPYIMALRYRLFPQGLLYGMPLPVLGPEEPEAAFYHATPSSSVLSLGMRMVPFFLASHDCVYSTIAYLGKRSGRLAPLRHGLCSRRAIRWHPTPANVADMIIWKSFRNRLR